MKNEIVLFENQNIKLKVNMKDGTVWLNAEQMAKLFDRDSKTIRKHINNVLEEELKKKWLSQNLRQPLNMVQSKIKFVLSLENGQIKS